MSEVNGVSVIQRAVGIYGRHWKTVLGLSLAIHLTYLVVSMVLLNAMGIFGFFFVPFLLIVASQLTVGVMSLLVGQIRLDNDVPPAGELLKAVAPRIGSLAWQAFVISWATGFVYIIGALIGAAMGASLGDRHTAALVGVLVGASLALLVYTRWSVTAPALVIGRMTGREGRANSAGLVKGNFFSALVVVLLQVMVSLVGTFISRHAAADQSAFEDVFIAQALVTAFIAPISAIALAELFMELSGYSPDATPVTQQATSRAVAAPAGWTPYVPGGAPGGAAAGAPAGYGQPSYAAASAAQPYGATPAQPYGATPAQPYGAAPAQPGYGAQPAYPAYAQPATQPYGAQPGYGAAPAQPAYAAAPQQPSYAATPAQPTYAAAPAQPAYAQPPAAQPPYGSPAAAQPPAYGVPAAAHPAYASPQAGPAAYGAPPTQAAYPQPPAAPAYGTPPGTPPGAHMPPATDRPGSVAPPGFG